MIYRTLLLLLLLCSSSLLNAQVGNKWAQHHMATNVNYNAVATDANGNLYAATENITPGGQLSQAVTEKYDSVGNLLWSNIFSYPAGVFFKPVKLLVDGAGNVYVAGDILFSLAQGLKCVVIYKLNAAGTQLWADTLQGTLQGIASPAFQNYITDMEFDPLGNIVLAGSLSSPAAIIHDHMFSAKIDPSGTELWRNHTGVDPGSNAIRNIAIDASGNIFAVGYGGYGPSGGRMVVRKYSAGGALLWQDVYDADSTTTANESGVDVKVDGSGNVYAAGTVAIGGHTDYILRKYTTSGNLIWSETISSSPGAALDEVSKLYVTASGDAYLTGITKTIHNGPEDIFTVKVNASGVVQWTDIYGYLLGFPDVPLDMAGKDNPEKIVITGYSSRTSFFIDPITIQYNPDGTRKSLKRFKSWGQGHGAAVAIGSNNNVYVAGRDGHYGVVMRIMDADTFKKINIPGPGYYDFSGSTALAMNMGAGTGTGDVTVNFLANKAANISWAAGTKAPLDISGYRWVIDTSLTVLPATINMSFDLAALNAILTSLNASVLIHGIDHPAHFTIYHRAVDGMGKFSRLPTTYANGKIFAQITGSGEFVIGSETDTFNYTGINSIKNAATVFGDINVYPNPANDHVNISFVSKLSGVVSIRLYDLSGKEVRTIYNGQITQGNKTVTVNVAGLSTGLYLCKFSSADNTTYTKISVVH